MIQKLRQKLNNDEHLKELLHGSAITFVIKITGMLLGYMVILFVSRNYGAEGTGIYTLTSRLLNSLAIFAALGMNVSVLRYVGQFNKEANPRAKLRQLFKYIAQLAFPFAILVGLGLFFFANEIAVNFFDNSTYTPALKIGAIALPFFTLNLINVEFIRGLKFLKVSEYLRSINRHLIVIVLLAFSVFSYGVLDAIYALVAGLLLTFVFSISYILRYFKLSQSFAGKFAFSVKELFATSMPMMITTVASLILANVGVVFLEIYSTTNQVGIFSVCLALAQLVSLVLVVVNTISGPKFSELFWANKKQELKKVVRQSSKIIFLTSIVLSLGIAFFSKFLLGMFGQEFKIGTTTLMLLLTGQVVNAVTGSVSIFLNMTGNQNALKNIIVVTTILAIIGYLFLVPNYGIEGAAFAFMGAMVILNVSAAFYTYKKLEIVTFYIPFFK